LSMNHCIISNFVLSLHCYVHAIIINNCHKEESQVRESVISGKVLSKYPLLLTTFHQKLLYVVSTTVSTVVDRLLYVSRRKYGFFAVTTTLLPDRVPQRVYTSHSEQLESNLNNRCHGKRFFVVEDPGGSLD
jgi:hypothetical protein